MAKFKRWERPVEVYERQRTVRHSRMRLREMRGVACEECGDLLHPSHVFAAFGCICESCWLWWQGGQSGEAGSQDALRPSLDGWAECEFL